MPLIHTYLNPEDAHVWAIWLAKKGLSPKDPTLDDPRLKTTIWNRTVRNPIGLAAGFDKNAEAIDGLLDFGFGLVEVGSITPQPQPGNPQPRMFRLENEKAVINRYGFNSNGHQQVALNLLTRLQAFAQSHLYDPEFTKMYQQVKATNVFNTPIFNLPYQLPLSLKPDTLLGVNLGKNKSSPAESNQDYIDGVKSLGPFADYLVVNISSPNTPGLRSLQRREPIEKLMNQVIAARDAHLSHKPPLLVKIAPDLSDEELNDIAHVVQSCGVDGIIISNTTISRPEYLTSESKNETGGLSGPPVFPLALNMIKKFYKLTEGKIPIVGCGGISSGKDALEFCKAGASLVQLYTALGYEGPGLIARMKQELADELQKENKTWAELVGTSS